MFLLMKFFNVSAWRNFHSIQFSGSSHQKVFLLRSFGNLGIVISATASSLESTLASPLQKIYFCLQNFFLKNRIFMFFLVFSYGISTTLLQIIISLWFPIHPSKDLHWCSRKSLIELSETSVHWCFEKETVGILCILFSKTSRVEIYLRTLAGLLEIFPKSSLEQLFCREPVKAYF